MKKKPHSQVNNGRSSNFELKHKVVVALNKLADRDTCQLAIHDLQLIAQSLAPPDIPSFLSCILLHTSDDHKIAVRKECLRLMATLFSFHPNSLLSPHLPKMVATVVKRLKDPDSLVRDACLQTMSVFATNNSQDAHFVVLLKPLFEALSEHNKHIQGGAALCLSKVIDSTPVPPPVHILHPMLSRTVKLLNTPHFLAKSALLHLIRSIIQAGGAPSHTLLSAAMATIQEALKDSDWTTRKAASFVLGELAGPCLHDFKTSSVRSLESCRFDKVKPVRDTVLHALRCWKSLLGPDTPEPSEAGSSMKENFCGGDYSDLTSTGDSISKDAKRETGFTKLARIRSPLSVKKSSQNYMDAQHAKADDWNIEIAVPKARNFPLSDFQNEESEGSCVTKTMEGIGTDVTSIPDTGCEYVSMDDKQECSSVSDLVANNYVTKFATPSNDSPEGGCLLKPLGRNQKFATVEIGSQDHMYTAKMQDRRSIESAVTDASSQPYRECCVQLSGEMAYISKQLLEIENKQATLMEQLQVFSTGIMDSLSMLQSKVLGLEYEVDRIGHTLVLGGRHSESAISKIMKQNQSVSSPRLSTCTPRPSVHVQNRHPPMPSAKNNDIWEEKTFSKSRLSNSAKQGSEISKNTGIRACRNAVCKDIQKTSGQGSHSVGQMRNMDSMLTPLSSPNVRQNGSESKNWLRQHVEGFLCKGDIDSAYVEALCSRNELILIELLDRTGPVLDSLSHTTISDVLSTLASFFLEQRFVNSIIPWLQQVVDLSTAHGPDYLVLSAKARREVLSAMQQAVNMEFSNTAERRLVTQLGIKLHHLWELIHKATNAKK
ncbi:hypothetical protein K2173_017874 [Erythroxylum novogranatense]|uniref:TOG domain-containing protein n=1 Tax=Erythroxylum novogranatense TaxID=1862640 RepID=A0AAV8SML3_9ROSI|nr:hypothetical protein K2173_017874 [Erythroxylum novogranatense]